MPFDGSTVRDAIRLLKGEAISLDAADSLADAAGSRDQFLCRLLLERGCLARYPELSAALQRAARPPAPAAAEGGASDERAYYERLLASLDPAQPTAIYVPRWPGVCSSTINLFRQAIPVPPSKDRHPDDVDAAAIDFYAGVLSASGVQHFVVSGNDLFNIEIVKTVLRQKPDIRFDLFWHSNFLQIGEPPDWNRLQHWLQAIAEGLITRVGVVKSGLDTLLRQLGIDAVFVPNVVRIAPPASKPTAVDNIVGIWLSGSSSYRKLPHAMIAAVKAMPGSYLKASGLGPDGLALVSALDVPFVRLFEAPIPQEQLYQEIPTTALSLYVTISEGSPMLPLESFALGVPCLVGPCSHLFRDHLVLRRALVVDQPCNPSLIADMALDAMRDRLGIMAAYRDYAAEQEAAADAALARFLS